MIKAFRPVRNSLLVSNKLAAYALYALGEIVLVVVGILIAIQINNWNENQILDQKVKSSLLALKDDLVRDTIMIRGRQPYAKKLFELNELFRKRVAQPKATVDTLVKIMRYEFNPVWTDPVIYTTNSYSSLNSTGLIERIPDTLRKNIKNLYISRDYKLGQIESSTLSYRSKYSSYLDSYTFGSTQINDHGKLIDAVVWENTIDYQKLAAAFNGISNFKRVMYLLTIEEFEYSLENSRELINQIDAYMDK